MALAGRIEAAEAGEGGQVLVDDAIAALPGWIAARLAAGPPPAPAGA